MKGLVQGMWEAEMTEDDYDKSHLSEALGYVDGTAQDYACLSLTSKPACLKGALINQGTTI